MKQTYFTSNHLNNIFSRNGIKNQTTTGKIFHYMVSRCLWSKTLIFSSFWEAISILLYSYVYIKKYAIWHRDGSAIKSFKEPKGSKKPQALNMQSKWNQDFSEHFFQLECIAGMIRYCHSIHFLLSFRNYLKPYVNVFIWGWVSYSVPKPWANAKEIIPVPNRRVHTNGKRLFLMNWK